MKKRSLVFLCLSFLFAIKVIYSQPWKPDLGNGKYKNPVIFADYSDPDLIRVDDDFYMVASSFNCMPGIPVLHSKDLINWEIIGYVYDSLPLEKYDKPAHGEGSWAPSLRYHKGEFYVYFCTPHDGLFMAKTNDPAGKWELHHVAEVELWEDPCPFWDDDGNAYLARSKVGADVLILHKMSNDGTQLLDNGTLIFSDLKKQPVIEGPKFMKKDGFYYILAPAGGVAMGWQTALRSKDIYGPYESKIVLHQGNTNINGPHQGGLVELKSGKFWFMHFQDRGIYGRIVHLQPVKWEDGWPMMGIDNTGDGIGEPVMEYAKPDVGKEYPRVNPQTSDDFNGPELGLQWQWHANPKAYWYSLKEKPGHLRLYGVQNLTQNGNFWKVPNLLLQKFPAPSFTAVTKLEFKPEFENEKCGLVVMGEEWAFLAIKTTSDGLKLGMYEGKFDLFNDATIEIESVELKNASCYLKVFVNNYAICSFSYSLDGKNYMPIGREFKAKNGRWIGAKVGLFCINPNMVESKSYADFDWFRVE